MVSGMRRKSSTQHNSFQKILAVTAIPAVFYLSGAMVIYKVLSLANVNPRWSDFAFFNTVNHGLSLFTGFFTQPLWFVSVLLIVILAIIFIRFKISTASAIAFLLIIGIANFTSGKVATQTIVASSPVHFDFDPQSPVSPAIRDFNQKNELRLLLVNNHDYIVLQTNGIINALRVKGIRIPDNHVAMLTVAVNNH
jgi:hypothetical protein